MLGLAWGPTASHPQDRTRIWFLELSKQSSFHHTKLTLWELPRQVAVIDGRNNYLKICMKRNILALNGGAIPCWKELWMWGQDYWGWVLVQELTSHVTLSKPLIDAHRLSFLNYKIEGCSEKTNERTQVKGLYRHPDIVQRYHYYYDYVVVLASNKIIINLYSLQGFPQLSPPCSLISHHLL